MDEDHGQDRGGAPPRDISSTKSTVAFFDGPVPRVETLDRTVADPTTRPPAPSIPLGELPGRALHHFRIDRRIGEGGMGTVFEAHDLSLDRPVAVKVIAAERGLDLTQRERFIREARSQARLVHPNVVPIHYVGEQDGMLFFSMELVGGGALDEITDGGQKLEWRRCLELMIDVAGALRVAHREGIVHRDIKPSNLLLDADGRVKVADFGLAKKIEASPEELRITQAGTLLGSPLYMSPEQGEGKPLDHRSDIYSLGATFYHLLAGRPPFEGESAYAMISQHLTGELPAIRKSSPDVPEALAAILERMMAKAPADRYQDYDELIADLQDARPQPVARAGFWTRAMAFAVDAPILLLLLAVFRKWGALLFALYVVIGWWRRGKTVGKWIFQMRVRTRQDERLSLLRAVGRFVVLNWGLLIIGAIATVRLWSVDLLPDGFEGSYDDFRDYWVANSEALLGVLIYTPVLFLQAVGLLIAGVGRRKLALHDWLCRTQVVYDIGGERRARRKSV